MSNLEQHKWGNGHLNSFWGIEDKKEKKEINRDFRFGK